MINELKKVLNDFKIQYPKDKQKRLFQKLLQDTDFIVDVDTTNKYVVDDPDDDIFVQTAISANADYIISQDKHLLKLKKIKDIEIIHPGEFLIKIA